MMDKINLLDTVSKDIRYFQDYIDRKKWFNPFEIILKECRTNGEKNGLYSLFVRNENARIEVAFGTIQEINCALKAMIAWEELNND